MQILTSFVGKNKDFRSWLVASRPMNVVSLAAYKRKKAAKKAAFKNIFGPSIA